MGVEGVVNEFVLHPQIQNDTFEIGKLPLCEVLLHNDSRFKWLILVPRRANIIDVSQLDLCDQHLLMQDINHVVLAVKKNYSPERVNIAMIGNKVSQLHCHIVARFQNDAVWPETVWGNGKAIKYNQIQKEEIINRLKEFLF